MYEECSSSYIELLSDDLIYKISIELDINDFISFREALHTTSNISKYSNDYEKDILAHFYVKYNVPKSQLLLELISYFNNTRLQNLLITVGRNDKEDYVRLIGDEPLEYYEDTNELLSIAHKDMYKTIIDGSIFYDYYISIMLSNDPELIRYNINKIIGDWGNLGSIDSTKRDVASYRTIDLKDDSIDLGDDMRDSKELAINILLEYDDNCTYVIIGYLESDNIELATKYITGTYKYDYVELIRVIRHNIDTVFFVLDTIPYFDEKCARRLVSKLSSATCRVGLLDAIIRRYKVRHHTII